MHGEPFPEGVRVAENLVDKGIIDAVVHTQDLADVAGRALALLSRRPCRSSRPRATEPAAGGEADGDAWASITFTRRPDRPGVRELLRHAADDVLPLNGTQSGETDSALLLALISFSGTPCVLVGQDRRAQTQHRPLGPAALRSALRGVRIAQGLRLPLVCVIDTPGADLRAAAEEGALAGEIARCLAQMVELTVARRHRVRTADLLADGIVHAVISEEVAAHEDPTGFARRIAAECVHQILMQRHAGM